MVGNAGFSMILMRGPPLASADYLGISLDLETSLPLGGGEVFTDTFNNSLCRHIHSIRCVTTWEATSGFTLPV